MGQTPSVSSQGLDVSQAISEAYVTVTQDISQGVVSDQIASFTCAQSNACPNCIKGAKILYPGQDTQSLNEIKNLCAPICACDQTDVNINSTITMNASAFLSSSAQQSFLLQFMNSIYNQSQQTQTGFSASSSTSETINKSIQKIYNEMSTSSMQTALQSVKSLQVIQVNDVNLTTVNLNDAINYISQIIQQNSTIQQELTAIETEILSSSFQLIKGGLAAIIAAIVQIILAIIVLIMIGFIVELGFEFYTLYVV